MDDSQTIHRYEVPRDYLWHPVPGDATYRGSVIANGGMFVWHLFEMLYPPESQKAPA